MLILAIVLLFLLAVVNFIIGKRVLVYPPFVYSAIWTVALAVIWIAGNLYYPLSTKTLGVFISGGCAFSIGAGIALTLPIANLPVRANLPAVSNRLLTLLVLIVIAGAPFAVLWIVRAVLADPTNNFLVSARGTVFGRDQGIGAVLVRNFLILAAAVALLAFRENESAKKRSFLAIFAAIVLTFLTGARNTFIPLIFSLLYVDWMRNRKIRWKLLFVLTFVLLVLSSITAVFFGKAGADPNTSLKQNAAPVLSGIVEYATAPLVAYDQVVRSPSIVPHFMGVSSFVTHLMYRFDSSFREPFSDMDWYDTYVCISPVECQMNVFTIYFSYIDFGFFGMLGILTFLGVLVTSVYRYASRGHPIAILMYALLFSAVILSIFQEYFFDYANYLLKCLLVFWSIYSLPSLVSRVYAIAHRTAARILPKVT